MGFRFRKKIKIVPGLAINLNKSIFSGKVSGCSVSIGGQGLGANVNKDGIEGFGSIDPTGLGYRTKRHKWVSDDEGPKLLTFRNICIAIVLLIAWNML